MIARTFDIRTRKLLHDVERDTLFISVIINRLRQHADLDTEISLQQLSLFAFARNKCLLFKIYKAERAKSKKVTLIALCYFGNAANVLFS